MKLKVSSPAAEPVPGSESLYRTDLRESKKPLLLIDFLRRFAEQIRREIDTEVRVEDSLPRETAIDVPEERFAYLLTLLYRFLSISPRLGDPSVSADAHGDGIAVSISAKKMGADPLGDREALGISDHYFRLIANELAACGAQWYFDRTKDRYAVVLTLAKSGADVSRLLAPIPAGIARAVRSALKAADRIIRASRV